MLNVQSTSMLGVNPLVSAHVFCHRRPTSWATCKLAIWLRFRGGASSRTGTGGGVAGSGDWAPTRARSTSRPARTTAICSSGTAGAPTSSKCSTRTKTLSTVYRPTPPRVCSPPAASIPSCVSGHHNRLTYARGCFCLSCTLCALKSFSDCPTPEVSFIEDLFISAKQI